MKSTTYGQKGGEGPNRGKIATKWKVTLPDGTVVMKNTFRHTGDLPDTCVATGFMHEGKPHVCVWVSGNPPWEGCFGRLTAERVKP